MSIRHYRPRGERRRGPSFGEKVVLYVLLAIAIGTQVAYPLVHGNALRDLTLAIVYFGALAMLVHGYLSYGIKYSLIFIFITFFFALGIEEVGSRTGWPFGRYHYDHSLGFQIAGVPLVVPFAWLMLSHPILVLARRLSRNWVFLVGGIGLMAWDLFLDPQMVVANRWTWKVSGPHTPLEPGIPLSNSFGWLLSGIALMGLLNLLLPKERRRKGANQSAPEILLAWTFFSGVVGNLFFFHRPGVAVIGGLVFGAMLAPYFFKARFGRPDDQ